MTNWNYIRLCKTCGEYKECYSKNSRVCKSCSDLSAERVKVLNVKRGALRRCLKNEY